ncbi:CRISPR-associated endoribonuclease Cas6 [Haloferax namakaokahaiae]|uniref:CRISPR-associated endoribonuclease Cas6 n=1 Tax=Haloferax namakaokahaiae TaxID=1748331 RepID=A0ABD5ZIV5_9EURY
MRLLVRLRADADAAYDNQYHRGLAGRVWRALDGEQFDELHDQSEPTGLSMSNPFPVESIEEGDRRNVLIASARDDVLRAVASSLIEDREFNIKQMPFTVEEVTGIEPDVGEPGTEGMLTTDTGLVVRIPHWKFDEYGIDAPSDAPEFWRAKHTLEPLKEQLENNLDRKHGLYCDDYLPGPSDVEGDLFTSYEHIKTYALPVTVTEGVTETHVLSKFRFGYRVRDDDHRRHLNLALDCGLAERNSLGFGFVNIREDKRVPPGGRRV